MGIYISSVLRSHFCCSVCHLGVVLVTLLLGPHYPIFPSDATFHSTAMSTMGMSVKSSQELPPVTRDVLQRTAARIGVRIPEHLEEEFTEMLASARDAMEKVLQMDGTSSFALTAMTLVI